MFTELQINKLKAYESTIASRGFLYEASSCLGDKLDPEDKRNYVNIETGINNIVSCSNHIIHSLAGNCVRLPAIGEYRIYLVPTEKNKYILVDNKNKDKLFRQACCERALYKVVNNEQLEPMFEYLDSKELLPQLLNLIKDNSSLIKESTSTQ